MLSSITPHACNTPLSRSLMNVDLKRSKYPVQDTQDGDSPKRPLEVTPVETTKQCNTPGCTYREFHIGPHSNDISGCKRARKTVEPFVATPSTRGTDAHGLGTYDSVCKSGQRAMFTAVAMQQKCTALRPAVYLDGPDAALTKSLLDAGCDPKALMPINNSAPTAEQIERECPSVRCVVDDICRLAALAEPDAYGVVWFDMCGVDFGQFDVQTLLHCAKYKFFTLSCRQIICSSQQDALCHQLVEAKERITSPA